jgi:hypothetical protein
MNFPLLISAAGILVCIVTTFVATDLRPARLISEIESTLKHQLIISTVIMTPVSAPGVRERHRSPPFELRVYPLILNPNPISGLEQREAGSFHATASFLLLAPLRFAGCPPSLAPWKAACKIVRAPGKV